MLKNILGHIINIFHFIGIIIVKLILGAGSFIMFLAMLICGILGFGVFTLFLIFMVLAFIWAILL